MIISHRYLGLIPRDDIYDIYTFVIAFAFEAFSQHHQAQSLSVYKIISSDHFVKKQPGSTACPGKVCAFAKSLQIRQGKSNSQRPPIPHFISHFSIFTPLVQQLELLLLSIPY
jgi:hypothetical protein